MGNYGTFCPIRERGGIGVWEERKIPGRQAALGREPSSSPASQDEASPRQVRPEFPRWEITGLSALADLVLGDGEHELDAV